MPRWCLLWCAIAAMLPSPAAHCADSLFERLGGDSKLSAVVSVYVDRLSNDPRTRRAFEGTNPTRIKRVLHEQLCDLTGGPCRYAGDTMRDVHAGHGIDDREFLSGVELLHDVLKEQGIGLRERNELLALLAPMKKDVVDSTSTHASR